MRGETRAARRAANEAVELGGGPLAQMVLGYAELAALRGARGEAAFRRALQEESWNPLALLGLGLGPDQAGRSGGRHRPDRERGRARPGQQPAAVVPRQSVLRGAARRAGGHAVRDREGAGPERPDAVVLRCDPEAAR